MAYGASLVGHLVGSLDSVQVRAYAVVSTDATALYIGDFVKTDGTTGALNINNVVYPAVVKADAGDVIRGVVVGIDQVIGLSDAVANQSLLYRPASTQRVLYVVDDPFAIFQIAANSAIVLSKMGENADFVYAAGSTVTGLSGSTVSATTGTGTANLRLLGVASLPDNTAASVIAADAPVLVLINEHELKSTTGV